ncbi:DUF6783 domain-containing protein [Blautia sp. HCP3S3_H10_1]
MWFFFTSSKACLKKAFCNLHAPLCVIFCPLSVGGAQHR